MVKIPSLQPSSTATTVDDAVISAVGSIPPLPPLTMTAITTVNNRYCCCNKVNNVDHQKPVVIVCCQLRQWRSSLAEAVVDGGCGNGGLCLRQLLSTEAVVEWRNNDATALVTMHLWLMVVVAMVVVIVICAAAVDAAATIPSLVLMAATKMPLPPPPSTTASIDNDCYHCCQ